MPKHIVGIGISEQFEVAWATLTDNATAYEDRHVVPVPYAPLNERNGLDLQATITGLLDDLGHSGKFGEIFERDIDAVGFAAIGRVNPAKRQLVSIARKDWLRRSAGDGTTFIADFKAAVGRHFPKAKIVAQNDATAVALAEHWSLFEPAVETMFYVTLNEGVNAGLIYKGRLLELAEHPEFGHTYPRLHSHDVNRPPGAGCPMHGYCYEALASAARVRHEWGGSLEQLADDHQAWDIIGYYGAQLCLAGHAVFAPKRIVLGGSLLWGLDPAEPDCSASQKIERLLLPAIRQNYIKLRGSLPLGEAAFGHAIEPRALADILIQRGALHTNVNGLGALELARQNLLPDLRGL